MIKAIFFDIDGTLLSFTTHKIPQSTLDAIKIVKEKGIKTFIATGRSALQIGHVTNYVDFDGFVTLNGGYCLTGDHKAIYKNPIPKEDIKAIVQYIKTETEFPCFFVGEKKLFINKRTKLVEEIEELLDINFGEAEDINQALEMEIFQMVPFFNHATETKLMNSILSHCDVTRWNPKFADIIAKGNSKQVGIDKVLEYYKIPLSDCMSFGDGGNDIPMLKHTPISVAMGNAEDNVKACATHVTTSVDDNGIWNMLKELKVI